MPKPQYQLKDETINALLVELQRVTNCKLQSHSDSIKIAEILNAAKYQISPHTISRLTGFFSSTTKPYLYNINAIAQFLGYRDVYDFEKVSSGQISEVNVLSIFESRALIALELLRAEEFADYYSRISPLSPAHIRLNHIIATEFRTNTTRADQIIHAIEKNERARLSYFHHFVDEDNQGFYFLNSIERIYTTQVISIHEKIFYEEYANNKYFERGFGGLIPFKSFKANYKKKVSTAHIEFPHLYSRLFVNFLYTKAFNGELNDKKLEVLLKEGIQHAKDTNYAPFRIAWLGRLVRTYLFIGAEHILKQSDLIKEEILWAMTTNIVDYEFQSILQFEGLRLGIVRVEELKSFKGGWYSASLTSSAWDLLSASHSNVRNKAESLQLKNEAIEITHLIQNKLMRDFIQTI
ncbi:MAG: hypothetical protein RL138_550 [Bacteroidota bacterium]